MAEVYVGTYKKYNEGNLFGKWISLDSCNSYEDFLQKCREVHKDEKEPEFMIQDNDDLPEGLDTLEWISESEFNDIKEALNDSAPKIGILDYSEKAIAVIGDTILYKDSLKRLGGKFNARLTCGAGWIFPKSKTQDVQKLINGSPISEIQKSNSKSENKFVQWLKEYLNKIASDTDEKELKYLSKSNVGAIKFDDGYYLIDKEKIENSFCFPDEGPSYEFYKSLMDDEAKLKAYFINENTSKFKAKIQSLKEGKKAFLLPNTTNGELYCEIPRYVYDYEEMLKSGKKEATPEQVDLLLKGLEFGLADLEKRLDAYLKRYGVSKLHTWTYWENA